MKNLMLTMIFLSAWLNARAQPALSLSEACSVALERNLSIQQAENSARMAHDNATPGNAGLLPRLDLSSGTTVIDADVQMPSGGVKSRTTRNTAGLTASYTLFRGFQGLNSYKLLKTQSAGADLQYELVAENTLYAVAQAYFGLLTSSDNLRILKEQISVSRERLAQVQDKNDLGMSSRLQVLSARVDFDSDSSSVLEAEFRYEESRRRLNLLLGWELNREYQPVLYRHDFGHYNEQDLITLGLHENTNMRLSENLKIQSSLNVKSAGSTRLPSLSLSGSYAAQQVNTDIDWGLDNPDLTFSTGLQLSWSLFDGRKTHQIQSARIQKKNAELNTLAIQRQTTSDLQSAYRSFVKSLQLLDLKQNNLASARLNFEQTSELFRLGTVSSTQFRTSQLNVTRVKFSLVQARYSACLDEVKLWQLTGKLQQLLVRFEN